MINESKLWACSYFHHGFQSSHELIHSQSQDPLSYELVIKFLPIMYATEPRMDNTL